jgi:hypothetical protein
MIPPDGTRCSGNFCNGESDSRPLPDEIRYS